MYSKHQWHKNLLQKSSYIIGAPGWWRDKAWLNEQTVSDGRSATETTNYYSNPSAKVCWTSWTKLDRLSKVYTFKSHMKSWKSHDKIVDVCRMESTKNQKQNCSGTNCSYTKWVEASSLFRLFRLFRLMTRYSAYSRVNRNQTIDVNGNSCFTKFGLCSRCVTMWETLEKFTNKKWWLMKV